MEMSLDELDRNSKNELLRVLFMDVKMGKMTRPLEVALSITTASLVKVFKGETTHLALPKICRDE